MGWFSDFVRAATPVAMVLAPEFAPEIAAVSTLAQGGSPEQAAKSAAATYVAGEIGKEAAPTVSQELGVTPETGRAVGTGLGATGGALITGASPEEAAKRGVISGAVQGVFGSPGEDATTGEKIASAYEKQFATQALGNVFAPSTSYRTAETVGGAGAPTSVTTTGAGTSPGSSALAQACRTDLGAPIFGGEKDKEGRKSGWNVESLRYMGNVGEA